MRRAGPLHLGLALGWPVAWPWLALGLALAGPWPGPWLALGMALGWPFEFLAGSRRRVHEALTVTKPIQLEVTVGTSLNLLKYSFNSPRAMQYLRAKVICL